MGLPSIASSNLGVISREGRGTTVQSTSKRLFPDLVNFALAYHFCLNLPAAFSQPGNGILVGLCTRRRKGEREAQNDSRPYL